MYWPFFSDFLRTQVQRGRLLQGRGQAFHRALDDRLGLAELPVDPVHSPDLLGRTQAIPIPRATHSLPRSLPQPPGHSLHRAWCAGSGEPELCRPGRRTQLRARKRWCQERLLHPVVAGPLLPGSREQPLVDDPLWMLATERPERVEQRSPPQYCRIHPRRRVGFARATYRR